MARNKSGYFRQIRFFLGDFFEFSGDFHLEIPWQGHTTEDAWQDLFHNLSAFFGGNKLTDGLLAFRCREITPDHFLSLRRFKIRGDHSTHGIDACQTVPPGIADVI